MDAFWSFLMPLISHTFHRPSRATPHSAALPVLLSMLGLCASLSVPVDAQAGELPATVAYEKVVARPVPFQQPSATIIGQPYAYPKGTPAVTLFMIEIPPGQSTSLHKHHVPLIAYVISGSLEVDYGSKGKRTIAAGQGFVEAVDWCHSGRALGNQPAKLLGIYLGEANPPSVLAPPCKTPD
jgi:quercetin dioxygenase-like cupin family protein